jgi:hypothetical protein
VLLADLELLVFPWNLSSDRSYNQIPLVTGFDVAAWSGVFSAALLLAVAVARRHKDPLMFWCAGFFGIALLPVSNLVIVIGSIMAERFLYLPAAAFAIAATALIYRSGLRRHAPIVLAIAVTLFGARAFIRNRDWKDDYTLASHDVQVAPASFKLHGIVARTLFENNVSNIDQAISEAEKAWEIVRRLPSAQVFTQTPTNLGVLYRIKGDTVGGPGTPRGAEWYRQSLSVLEEARRDSQASGDAYDALQEAEGKPLAVRLERATFILISAGNVRAGARCFHLRTETRSERFELLQCAGGQLPGWRQSHVGRDFARREADVGWSAAQYGQGAARSARRASRNRLRFADRRRENKVERLVSRQQYVSDLGRSCAVLFQRPEAHRSAVSQTNGVGSRLSGGFARFRGACAIAPGN